MITELKILYTHTCSLMIVGFENGLEVPIKETDVPQTVLDAISEWNSKQKQVAPVQVDPSLSKPTSPPVDPVDDSKKGIFSRPKAGKTDK